MCLHGFFLPSFVLTWRFSTLSLVIFMCLPQDTHLRADKPSCQLLCPRIRGGDGRGGGGLAMALSSQASLKVL